ncbi:MAG: hypothetical protein L7V86_18035 [Verrucomicrobiales bacterium]|nr:hypothetical protein [Verrucomicrobiales bacterium]
MRRIVAIDVEDGVINGNVEAIEVELDYGARFSGPISCPAKAHLGREIGDGAKLSDGELGVSVPSTYLPG